MFYLRSMGTNICLLGLMLLLVYRGQCVLARADDGDLEKAERLFSLVESISMEESGDQGTFANVERMVSALPWVRPGYKDTLAEIEQLLQEGANPNILIARERYEGTKMGVLHVATSSSHLDLDLINLLLEYRADPTLESQPNTTENIKMNPIFIVARRFLVLEAELQGNGVSPQPRQTFQIMHEALRLLVKHANLRVHNPRDPLMQVDILALATYKGWPVIVQEALKSGADPLHRNISLTQVAFEAALNESNIKQSGKRYLQVIDSLIEHGDDPKVVDQTYNTNLLHFASFVGSQLHVRRFLYAGVDPSHLNVAGEPPALMAFREKHYEIARTLSNATDVCKSVM